MTEWRTHTPQYDGHAPDDWDGTHEVCYQAGQDVWLWSNGQKWIAGKEYRYRVKPDLLAQCLALPQAGRDALIEALQKPQRDWADDVAGTLWYEWEEDKERAVSDMADVIRRMLRPKEEN